MNRHLGVSALSSFDHDHFLVNRGWAHGGIDAVELYAFMHRCLDKLFGPGSAANGVLRVLAQYAADSGKQVEVADAIHQHFGTKAKIVGIASFLPEISAPECFNSWKQAQDALLFLVSVVSILRDRHGHACSTLEIVSGSCADGMWGGEDIAGDRVAVVNRLTMELAVDRLLSRLQPVAELALSRRVVLGVEMEPGPFFTIGDWRAIKHLCSKLDRPNMGAVGKVVGLNLDIAHWAFLDGITVEMIKGEPSVLRRIVHAHISDHYRGHCADAIPTTFHSAAEYLPWIELLTKICCDADTDNQKHVERLPYSGYVSCELESEFSVENVRLAIQLVRNWVNIVSV